MVHEQPLAPLLLETYDELLQSVGLFLQLDNSHSMDVYNLWMMREGMIWGLRSQPRFEGITIHSFHWPNDNSQKCKHFFLNIAFQLHLFSACFALTSSLHSGVEVSCVDALTADCYKNNVTEHHQ